MLVDFLATKSENYRSHERSQKATFSSICGAQMAISSLDALQINNNLRNSCYQSPGMRSVDLLLVIKSVSVWDCTSESFNNYFGPSDFFTSNPPRRKKHESARSAE
jgi:hypothetical protein